MPDPLLRSVAPITQGARDIHGLLPHLSADSFSQQVADYVAAQDEKKRQKREDSVVQEAALNTALGAGVGGLIGGLKAIPFTREAWNPKVVGTTAAIGGATALAFTLARHALKSRLAQEAEDTISKTDPAAAYVAKHPSTKEKAREMSSAQWAPWTGLELGALTGGVGGLLGTWAAGKEATPENQSMVAGLGALAGGVAGLGLGYLYRRRKNKDFLEHVEREMSEAQSQRAQEAAVRAAVESPELTKAASDLIKSAIDGIRQYPVSSTNAGLLRGRGGPPDRFAASKNGAKKVYAQALDDIQSFFKKKADDDILERQNDGDDLPARDMARILEETFPGREEQPSPSQKIAADLPYRKRVEVIAVKDGKIYGGTYEQDKSFGMFGGGLDDDDIVSAAQREFLEESGKGIKNPRVVPIDPVRHDWHPPYKSEKQAERAKKYRGSETYWVVADYDDSVDEKKAKGADGKSNLRNVRFYDVPEIESLMQQAPSDELSPTREARLKAIRHAVGQEKTADAVTLLPRKEVLYFTPAGKLAVKRTGGRRFELPSEVDTSEPVPYEVPITFVPETGVPEKGFHGYNVSLQTAQGDLPEGFEEVEPEAALQDLYAALGKPENRQFSGLDRARARALLRILKKRPKATQAA